jgi:hypothetical protein
MGPCPTGSQPMTKRVRRSKVDLDKKLKELEAKKALEPVEPRCKTCRHEEAAALIAGFFERKRDGRTTISFQFFYDGCLKTLPGYNVGYSVALTHVRRHLGVDPHTGRTR